MKKKVLLMGRSGSGKTSMRSIIFANYIVDVEHSSVRFLGNLVLNLWDCGGQDAFMENYLESQRDHIFRNVEVLIYVFDVESKDVSTDVNYYQSCLEAIMQYSKNAKIFCLIHKMDLIPEESREEIFQERSKALTSMSAPMDVTCFKTSIWDETLYKAWSCIVNSLVPNINMLQTHLSRFAEICESDEVVLFERATFLEISRATRVEHEDIHRFEKISNIVKQFKLSCSKLQSSFDSIEVKNSRFAAYIELFTSNTYIMVIMSDPTIESATTHLNISLAKNHFESFISEGSGGGLSTVL